MNRKGGYMADLLKNMYNHDSLHKLALDMKSVYSPFPVDEFMKSVMDKSWNNLELKGRMRQISVNLGKFLPTDYSEAIHIIDKVVRNYDDGFWGIFFPDFVEVFGQDEVNWDVSIAALERYTRYSSAEFAVRPFIINHEERMMAQMYAWSKHENEHVRRLSSEGCRPALPWGQAIARYKKDPAPVFPILEQLKADPSLYVRKSVANNINDISKTHPDLIASLAKEWYGENRYTNWVVKHGCRTLLKKGNRDVLALFGYDDINSVGVEDFFLGASSVWMGAEISFSFTVSAAKATKVRLEYGVDYVKSNGKTTRKIFQISESLLKANDKKRYTKNHDFTDLSTRKHYPGVHAIALIVNGVERGKLSFELVI